MNRYVLIENGVVVNAVVIEDLQQYPVEAGLTLLQHDTAGIGWLYVENNLIDPTPEPTDPHPVAENQPLISGLENL